MTTWPTTKGLTARLNTDAVRDYLQDDLPITWGKLVEARMREVGLRNVQVAVLADTTAQTIGKVIAGDIMPRDYLRFSIAAALGTSVEKLFPMPSMAEIEQRVTKRRRRVA